jgi:hypothetical protein
MVVSKRGDGKQTDWAAAQLPRKKQIARQEPAVKFQKYCDANGLGLLTCIKSFFRDQFVFVLSSMLVLR